MNLTILTPSRPYTFVATTDEAKKVANFLFGNGSQPGPQPGSGLSMNPPSGELQIFVWQENQDELDEDTSLVSVLNTAGWYFYSIGWFGPVLTDQNGQSQEVAVPSGSSPLKGKIPPMGYTYYQEMVGPLAAEIEAAPNGHAYMGPSGSVIIQ